MVLKIKKEQFIRSLLIIIFISLVVCVIILWKSSLIQPPVHTSQTALSNPASVNCEEQGGSLQIKTQKDGSQYGLCVFNTGYSCEEWQLFRGECDKPLMNQDTARKIIYNQRTGICSSMPRPPLSQTHNTFNQKNYAWQISLPKSTVPSLSKIQIGLQNMIGNQNDVYPLLISVTSPNGDLAFSKQSLYGNNWNYTVYPQNYGGANSQEKGTYTVVFQIYERIVACSGFTIQ